MAVDLTISTDFPFKSRYLDVNGSKIHYVDEGEGDPFLLIHGNPTSVYLWRNIIPHLTPLGRCVAPDLIGMGKSDKPDIAYSFWDFTGYLESFIKKLDLRNVTLVLNAWGTQVGLYYATRHLENVKGVAIMGTMLMMMPTWEDYPKPGRQQMRDWKTPGLGWDIIVNQNHFYPNVLRGGVLRQLSQQELDHYGGPFKDDPLTRKAIWGWPQFLPIAGEPPDTTEAFDLFYEKFAESSIPKLVLYSSIPNPTQDGWLAWCRSNLKHLKMVNVGATRLFMPEDNPHGIGAELVTWHQALQP